MTRYIIYHAGSGIWLREVMKSGPAPIPRLGEAVIPLPPDFIGDDTTHRIEDGEPVLIALGA
mgnify:CR=1 FL=1